jgi:hypothetical protein
MLVTPPPTAPFAAAPPRPSQSATPAASPGPGRWGPRTARQTAAGSRARRGRGQQRTAADYEARQRDQTCCQGRKNQRAREARQHPGALRVCARGAGFATWNHPSPAAACCAASAWARAHRPRTGASGPGTRLTAQPTWYVAPVYALVNDTASSRGNTAALSSFTAAAHNRDARALSSPGAAPPLPLPSPAPSLDLNESNPNLKLPAKPPKPLPLVLAPPPLDPASAPVLLLLPLPPLLLLASLPLLLLLLLVGPSEGGACCCCCCCSEGAPWQEERTCWRL